MNPSNVKEHEPFIACRFCGAEAALTFACKILERYDTGYYRCGECDSLMTERPTWTTEAYSSTSRPTDIAAAGRVEQCRVVIYWLWKFFRFKDRDRLLDWGGGDGLLVRKLRDDGINAFVYDAYTRNNYAIGFDGKPTDQYSMVTAFEVWEHLIDPRADVEQMFACGPKTMLISTGFYLGQDKDWDYLAPWSGRHVFFWSPKAIRQVGKKYGFKVIVGGSMAFFYRADLLGPIRKWLLRPLVSLHGMRTKQIAWVLWPKRSLRTQDREVVWRPFKGHEG